MRLILTSLAAGFVVFLAILTTRIWGLGQQFNDFNHAFLNNQTPWVIVKAENLPQIQEALKLKNDTIIWLDTRISSDGMAFVLPFRRDREFLKQLTQKQKERPQERILKGGKLVDYTWSEISAFYPEAPILKEIYQKFPTQKFILNVIDNAMNVDLVVVDNLKDSRADERTFIQSDTLVVMTSIKKAKPEWVYGTAQADLMRFLTFNSMWILPSVQFQGDVFVAPFKILNRPAFNDDVILEAKRRHKKIILGPVQSEEEFRLAQRHQANGYITENLPQLLTWLDQGRTQ